MPPGSVGAGCETGLRKFVAAELLTGRGARACAGRYVRNFGVRRVLLVTDPGVQAAGWPDEVQAHLAAEGVAAVRFGAVTSNPKSAEVAAGADRFREERCEGLVAVGGGSPIDCAKGIGIVVASRRPIAEFEGVDRVEDPIPPLLCVPTTAGSSADVSQFAMITLEEHRRKGVFISKALVPDVALVDPEPLTTAPPIHALASGLDALTHAFEALVSNARSDLTDALALHAVPLIARGLPAMHSAPTDVPTLTCLMKGSLAAGLAFSNASLGAAHALAHAVGGITDGSHGLLCGMLLEPVAAFNYQAEPERHDQFARALGVDVDGLPPGRRKEGLRSGLRALRETVGLEGSLRDLGVRPADVPDLAARAARDPCLVTNPRPAGRRDLEVILEEAL